LRGNGYFHHQVATYTGALLAFTFDAHRLAIFDSGRDTHLIGGTITGRHMSSGTPNGVRNTDAYRAFTIGAFGWWLLVLEDLDNTAESAKDIAESTLSTAGLAEESRRDIFETALLRAWTSTGKSCTGSHGAQLIVLLTLFRIGQHSIGFGDFFKALFGCLIEIGRA